MLNPTQQVVTVIENPVPGVHTLRIYENADAPLDISYDPLTLPDCPPQAGDTTQFNSSDFVTWSWSNETAGNLDSVTGLVLGLKAGQELL